MAEPAYDPSAGAPPDIFAVTQQVTGAGQPQYAPPQTPQQAPQQFNPPQPAAPQQPQPPQGPYQQPAPPAQPVPAQPAPAPQPTPPAPDQYTGPYAFGEEPWRQQPPGAPPTPGEPAVAPLEQPTDFLSYVQQKGFDLSQLGGENADPTAVVDFLLDRSHSVEEFKAQRPYIEFARRVAPYAAEIEQFLAQRGQAPQAGQVAPQQPTPDTGPVVGAMSEQPQLSAADKWAIEGLRKGTIKPEELLPQQRTSIAVWEDWRARRAEALLTNPMDVLRKDMQGMLEQEGYVRKDDLHSAIRERQEQDYLAAVAQVYAPSYHVLGADGRKVIDPVTQQPRRTDWGLRFDEADRYFQSVGVTNPVNRVQAIIRAIGEPPQGQPTAQPATPGPNGNVPPFVQPQPTPAVNPQQAFVQAATQAATQYPAYPSSQRGGVQGQPYMGTSPMDLALPDINDVAQELLGPTARAW